MSVPDPELPQRREENAVESPDVIVRIPAEMARRFVEGNTVEGCNRPTGGVAGLVGDAIERNATQASDAGLLKDFLLRITERTPETLAAALEAVDRLAIDAEWCPDCGGSGWVCDDRCGECIEEGCTPGDCDCTLTSCLNRWHAVDEGDQLRALHDAARELLADHRAHQQSTGQVLPTAVMDEKAWRIVRVLAGAEDIAAAVEGTEPAPSGPAVNAGPNRCPTCGSTDRSLWLPPCGPIEADPWHPRLTDGSA